MLIFVGLGVADAAVGWGDRSGEDYRDGEDDRKNAREDDDGLDGDGNMASE